MNLIETLEQEEIARLGKKIPEFAPGDTVIVSVNVVEGTRKRVQAYEGVVIAKRNRVDSGLCQLAINRRRQPRAAGGILRVGDHKVELSLGNQCGDRAGDDVAPRLTHDVADEEDTHRNRCQVSGVRCQVSVLSFIRHLTPET